jgi:hypothetical protein
MKRVLIAALAASGVAAPAMAATGNNYVDGYVALSSLNPDPGGSEDGTGAGVKAAFQVADKIFLTGEFQSVDYDHIHDDFDQIRLGAGFGPGMGSKGEGLYGRVEYVDFDFGDSDSGLGATAGYAIPLNPQFRVHGEVGYLLLDDVDGPELTIGGTYQVAQNLGIYADYRHDFLNVDGGGDIDIGDVRVGVRFLF